MTKKRLAICDNDRDYLFMMQSYLSKKSPAGFEAAVFDSLKKAQEASNEDEFEILLVGEGIYDDNVAKINAQKTFVLQEDGLLGDTGYSVIQKYQSMEKLIGQALHGFAVDEECMSTKSRGRTHTKLVCFYSPERHKGQSIAALASALSYADMGNRALYISMQPFSGFEQLLGTKYEADITDFMYFVLKHSDKLLYKLEGIKRTMRGADYLPPALDFSDLANINEDEWKRCFDALLYSSDYAYIVVDLTENCKGFYHLLEKSGKVYILSGNDNISRASFAQFEQLIKMKGLGGVIEKSVRFNLVNGWEEGFSDLEHLAGSPVGAYMKGILTQYG